MLPELVRHATLVLLLATLALLPFEHLLPDDFVIYGYTFTTLELCGLAALGAWLASLALDRRLPTVPLSVAMALGGLVAVGFASALLADGLNDQALDAAVHAAALGLLFLAVADTAVRFDATTWLAAAVVAGATLSTLVGFAGFFVPALGGQLGLGDFTTTGARRRAGTLD